MPAVEAAQAYTGAGTPRTRRHLHTIAAALMSCESICDCPLVLMWNNVTFLEV